MALIKVLIIFVVILALLNKSLPLYLAMIFGSLLMIVMFRLPLATAGQTALHTLTGWDVWSVNLAMYVISVLVYELDLRHRFEDAQRAMNGLMRDPRLNTSLACMFIGLMQGPATVTICGGMVDTMAGDHLKNDEKAAVATYLRHIPEAMVPTFTGVIVACSISGISISSFFVWMLPMALLTLLAIYLVYLRRVPRTVGETGRSKKECVRLLLRSLWSLLLAIAVIKKFSAQEVRDAVVKGFGLKSLLGITMTYVFKDLLVLSGVIDVLPTYFEHLPIPVFLVLVILYAFGTLVAGSSAAAAAFIPLAYTMIPDGGAFLLALLMNVSFASSQLSPTHICTAIISDYFGVTFFATVKKLLPLFLLTVLIACGYYMLLTAVF